MMWIRTEEGLCNLDHVELVKPPREYNHADNSVDWMIGFKPLSGADFELHFKTEKEATAKYDAIWNMLEEDNPIIDCGCPGDEP